MPRYFPRASTHTVSSPAGTLREFAQDDEEYFRWIWKEVKDLTKAQVEALEDIAGDEGVEL